MGIGRLGGMLCYLTHSNSRELFRLYIDVRLVWHPERAMAWRPVRPNHPGGKAKLVSRSIVARRSNPDICCPIYSKG